MSRLLFALGFIALGLVLMFDASASHVLERPLGWAVLIVGVIWLIGRIAWWMLSKNPD